MKRSASVIILFLLITAAVTGFNQLRSNSDLKVTANSVSKIMNSSEEIAVKQTDAHSLKVDSKESRFLSENIPNQHATPLKCGDVATKQLSFSDYLKILEKNPKFCGTTVLPNSVLTCLKGKIQNKIDPSCTQPFLNYLATLIKDYKHQPVSELNDLILKAQVSSVLFSPEGIKKEEFDQVLPSLYELIRRHPDNLGLLRVFVMIKAGIYLKTPLSDQDRALLDHAFAEDTMNSSTRKGIVTIFSEQKNGLQKVAELTRLYPQDIFAYATIISEAFAEDDIISAEGWADYALKQNPNNPDFKELRNQVFKKKFDVRKHKNYHIDISGAFEELLF